MLNRFLAAIFLAIFLLTPEILFAHGVGYVKSKFEAIPLEFFYSTGERMSYCEFKTFSPNDNKFAYQSGRTDENGRVAFVADTPGIWRVIVKDGEGHQCTAEIDIKTLSENQTQYNSQNINEKVITPFELAIRAILGVSLIFNVCLFLKFRSKNQNAY